jgi:hypothetical protein
MVYTVSLLPQRELTPSHNLIKGRTDLEQPRMMTAVFPDCARKDGGVRTKDHVTFACLKMPF